MQPVKSVSAVVGATMPVLWMGGLAWYFYRTNDAMGGMATKELGPTIIGLGVISGLFAIPLVIKLVRILGGGAAAAPKHKSVTAADVQPASDFDANAALERYLARKAAGQIEVPPVEAAGPTVRPAFGRKAI